jgi:hypothetical protein
MMSSQPANYCDPEILAALEEAFDAVWAVIETQDSSAEGNKDCERKAALSQTLGALVVDGVRDPAELQKRALQNLPLTSWPE